VLIYAVYTRLLRLFYSLVFVLPIRPCGLGYFFPGSFACLFVAGTNGAGKIPVMGNNGGLRAAIVVSAIPYSGLLQSPNAAHESSNS